MPSNPIIWPELRCGGCGAVMLTRMLLDYGEPIGVTGCVVKGCIAGGKVSLFRPQKMNMEGEMVTGRASISVNAQGETKLGFSGFKRAGAGDLVVNGEEVK